MFGILWVDSVKKGDWRGWQGCWNAHQSVLGFAQPPAQHYKYTEHIYFDIFMFKKKKKKDAVTINGLRHILNDTCIVFF